MLAQWAPNSACAPHDHGAASGIVWLIAGEFVETTFQFDRRSGLCKLEDSATLRAGKIIAVTPGDVHSMKVSGAGLSLHIYAPAIHAMKVFDNEKRQTLTVTGDCGAWIPADEKQILSVVRW